MPRVPGKFDRNSGIRDPSKIVIATEGESTEQKYFLSIKNKIDDNDDVINSPLELTILHPIEEDDDRKQGQSNPKAVLEQIKHYAKKHKIDKNDEFCVVVDRDRWEVGEISGVSTECAQKQNYFFALSNPSFEIWLLLHFENIADFNDGNKDIDGKFLKKRLSKNHAVNIKNLQLDQLWSYTDIAIQRAKSIPLNPKERWHSGIGTQVHIVVEKIKKTSNL